MVKAVLFDIDGVLLNSVRANAALYRAILEHFGHQGPADDAQQAINHYTMKQVLQHLVPQADEKLLKAMFDYSQTIEAGQDLLEMSEYADDLVKQLAKQYQLGLVSSRTHRGIGQYLSFASHRNYFPVVVGFEDTAEHKPHPAPLFFAVNRLGVSVAETVYVGDAATDVEAALAADMRVILYAAQSLPDATVTVHHLKDIVGHLRTM